MILPFVRELLADLENSVPFERVRRHLSAGSGRRRVSGLTFTGRALYLPLFVRLPMHLVSSWSPITRLLRRCMLPSSLRANLLARSLPSLFCVCLRTMCCRLRIFRRTLRFRSLAPLRCGRSRLELRASLSAH